jgi:hypothetical protein
VLGQVEGPDSLPAAGSGESSLASQIWQLLVIVGLAALAGGAAAVIGAYRRGSG